VKNNSESEINKSSLSQALANNKLKDTPLPVELIALDFDGTCANYEPTPHIDSSVMLQLRQARNQGIGWVLNSDRSISDLSGVASQLEAKVRPWAILSQQRAIHFLGHDGDYHPHREWNNRQAKIHNQLRRAIQPYFSEWTAQIHRNFNVLLEFVDEGTFSFMVPPEEIEQLGEMLSDFVSVWPDAIVSGNHEWRFVSHKYFSKGALLAEASAYMRIPSSRILAVGDSINDMSMLSPDVAGWIGCPSNSCYDVKELVSDCSGIIAREHDFLGTSTIIRHFVNASWAES